VSAVGEYVPEMIGPKTTEWVQVPTLAAVPDREDLKTEQDAHALRAEVAALNRTAPEGVAYRVRYVAA
jgi:hypothetical protein